MLPNFEKKYPSDDRLGNAIAAAERYIKNPSKKNKAASDAASQAADAASRATGSWRDLLGGRQLAQKRLKR